MKIKTVRLERLETGLYFAEIAVHCETEAEANEYRENYSLNLDLSEFRTILALVRADKVSLACVDFYCEDVQLHYPRRYNAFSEEGDDIITLIYQ